MENKNNSSYDYITNGNKMQTNKFYMQGGHETDTERQNNQDDLPPPPAKNVNESPYIQGPKDQKSCCPLFFYGARKS